MLDGTDAADTLLGGPDGDVVTGGKGNDTVDLGDGDDLFTRGPADGIDRVEGGAGDGHAQRVRQRAPTSRSRSRACWRARACCTGSPARPTRAASRHVSVHPFGGTDNVTVRDLSGTATTKVDVTLCTPPTCASTP